MRAQVVLPAARPLANAQIAKRASVHEDTARRWRGRFAEHGMPGLADHKRTGRPALYIPSAAAQAVAVEPEAHAAHAGRLLVERRVGHGAP